MLGQEDNHRARVAVVGSGMAGLATAYLLHSDHRRRYAVKVFESGDTLSLDSASISVPTASRRYSERVDLPMRAFAGGFYSNLKAMYDHLGVHYHSQPFLFEFAKVDPDTPHRAATRRNSPYFVHASNFHQSAPRPSAMALIVYCLEVVYLLACYSWFSLCCFVVGTHHGETVGQYLKRTWVPEYFVVYYLLPLMSSVTTCPHKSLLAFPASDLIDYKKRTHRAPHYTVSNGVGTVQEKLSRGMDCELNAVVSAVTPQGKGVQIAWKRSSSPEDPVKIEHFDRVVLAVAPDIVGKVFEPLKSHMARIPTTLVESVVHTDQSLLSLGDGKRQGNDEHGSQLIHLRTSTEGIHKTESLHVQRCGAVVTTCPFSPIDPSLKLHSARFTRVLRSPMSRATVNNIFEDTAYKYDDEKPLSPWKNGDDNVWLVGGWCWDGMVLLEGCVVSAMRVADAFGVGVPWRC